MNIATIVIPHLLLIGWLLYLLLRPKPRYDDVIILTEEDVKQFLKIGREVLEQNKAGKNRCIEFITGHSKKTYQIVFKDTCESLLKIPKPE